MKDQVVLPPRPIAVGVVVFCTAAAAAAAHHLCGWPLGGASVVATILVAPLVSLWWPRFATDTLGLHGTSLSSVPGGGDAMFLGRARELAAAVAAKRTCFLLSDWRRRAGTPNYQVWLGGARRVVLSHPADVAHVLGRVRPPRDASWMKGFGLPVSPKVLILTAGEEHSAARRLLAAPLKDERVLRMIAGGVAADLADEVEGPVGGALAAAADGGTPTDMAAVSQALTLRVVHRVMVSTPATDGVDFGPVVNGLIPLLMPLMLVPFPAVLARRRLARVRAVGDLYRRCLETHEAARRAAYAQGTWARSPPRDILDVLLADADKGGLYADRDRLAADWMVLMMTGVDSTSHSVEWGVYLLCTHPDVQEHIHAEVSNASTSRQEADMSPPPPTEEESPAPPIPVPTLTSLPYLDAVWRETLRLYPPAASGGSRRLVSDVVLPSSGAVLPAGTAIKMPHHVALHSPNNYARPEAFEPDRWLSLATAGAACCGRGGGGGGGTKDIGEQAWRPFGLGPLSCIGRRLAEVQWKAAVAALVIKYQLRLDADAPAVKPLDSLSLKPSHMQVCLRRRAANSLWVS